VLFYFQNRELPRCDLLSAVREPENIFLGGEAMGRCFIVVTFGILGGCHMFFPG